jgi:hypothetical protein
MTDNLKVHEQEIDLALKNKNYNQLHSLFSTNKFSVDETHVFYKRNQKLLESKKFWNSKFSHYCLQELLESDIKINFLKSYLEKSENCNHELNRHLLVVAKADFCKHFKLWKAFEYDNFFHSFKEIAKGDAELSRLVQELDLILAEKRSIAEEEERHQKEFAKYSFGDIALGYILFHYSLNTNDSSVATQYEVNLYEELNKQLHLCKDKGNMTFSFVNNEELQKQFQRNIGISQEDKFLYLYDFIESSIKRKNDTNEVELYSCGYADFVSTSQLPAPLHNNESLNTFKINNMKNVPEEFYFFGIDYFSTTEQKRRTDIQPIVEHFDFYGVSEVIQEHETSIDFEKVLLLLKYFSAFKSPAQLGILGIMNQGYPKFIELFSGNESITLFDYDKLVVGVEKYFGWTAQEAKSVVEYLSFDIARKNFPELWVYKPFMKLNNQVLWLGAFLRDRKWDNILLNRWKKEHEHKKLAQEFAKKFELKIAELFKSKSFKVIKNERFKSSNGQQGDFDVLAFKDNHLFVCEAKMGNINDDFRHAAYSETVRLEGCAAEQLQKAVANIEEDWVTIKEKLGIEATVELNSIKIIPLIITNYFEGDLKLYKNLFKKISFLELDVILNNQKKKLFTKDYLFPLQFSNNQNLNFEKLAQHPNWIWDLWEGKKEISADAIVRNIEKNTVWKEFEEMWKFEN